MRGTLVKAVDSSIAIARSEFQGDEENFGSIIADIARLLWPAKTAAHIAAAVGCSERNAEFWLSGKQKWSGDAIAAIVAEVLRRHSMRNVKIVRR